LRPANFTIAASNGTDLTPSDVWQTTESRLIVQFYHPPLPADAEVTLSLRNLADTAGNRLPDSNATQRFTPTPLRDTLPPILLPLDVDTTRRYSVSDSLRLRFNKGVNVDAPNDVVTLRDTAGNVARFRLVRASAVELHAFPMDTLSGGGRAMVELRLGSIRDHSGNRADTTLRFPIQLAPARLSGTLQGTLADTAVANSLHVLLFTLVATGKTYQLRGVKVGAWEMKGLPEGEYRVAAFRDSNNNGQHDEGTIAPWRAPEPFTEFSGTVRVRPRWTVNEVKLVVE